MENTMKSLFSYITLASIILSGGALAEEVVGKWGTKKFYGFAEYGILSSDFNLNTTVTSGILAVTSNVDSQGSIGKLGFGLSLSEKSAVELYAGKVSGISGTTTITATNAVIDGVTYNGSLSAIEDITADLIGINLVASDSYRFSNDSKISSLKLIIELGDELLFCIFELSKYPSFITILLILKKLKRFWGFKDSPSSNFLA